MVEQANWHDRPTGLVPGQSFDQQLREKVIRALRGARLHVWLAYRAHANRDGEAWPSNATLARESGYSVQIITWAKSWLTKNGWLVPTGKFKARVPVFTVAILETVPSEKLTRDKPSSIMKNSGGIPNVPHEKVTSSLMRKSLGEVRQEGKEKNAPDEKTHPAFAVVRDYAFHFWKRRFGQSPTWSKADYVQLAAVLKRNPAISEAEFRLRWDRYLASDDPFLAKRGYSLRYFCVNIDSFIGKGPKVPDNQPSILVGDADPLRKLTEADRAIYARHGISL